MKSYEEIYKFTLEIEDPDSREVILGFLVDIFKYECQVFIL